MRWMYVESVLAGSMLCPYLALDKAVTPILDIVASKGI